MLLTLALALAHALQLFKQLLRSSHPGRPGRLCRRRLGHLGRRRRRHILTFLIIRVIGIGLRRSSGCGGSVRGRSENKLSWRSVVQVSDESHVVCGSVQQIGNHIPWCAGAERAKNPLIAAQPFHLHPAAGGDLAQNAGQAGILGVDRETVVVEDNLRFLRWLLQQGGCSFGGLQESLALQESMALQEPMAPAAQRQAGLEAWLRDRRIYRAVEDERSARTMSTAAAECIRRS